MPLTETLFDLWKFEAKAQKGQATKSSSKQRNSLHWFVRRAGSSFWCRPQSSEITISAVDEGDVHQQCAVKENQSISRPRAATEMLILNLWLVSHSVSCVCCGHMYVRMLVTQEEEHYLYLQSVGIFMHLGVCLKNKQFNAIFNARHAFYSDFSSFMYPIV